MVRSYGPDLKFKTDSTGLTLCRKCSQAELKQIALIPWRKQEQIFPATCSSERAHARVWAERTISNVQSSKETRASLPKQRAQPARTPRAGGKRTTHPNEGTGCLMLQSAPSFGLGLSLLFHRARWGPGLSALLQDSGFPAVFKSRGVYSRRTDPPGNFNERLPRFALRDCSLLPLLEADH